MILIETEGAWSIIDKSKGTYTKIIKSYWLKKCPWIISNEVRALTKLKSKHFPKLISYDENSFTTDYCGKVVAPKSAIKPRFDGLEFAEIPNDFEEQVNEILDELEKANLRHSDINFTHFLIKDGIIKLIDFELCLEYGEPEPKNYMKTMGIEAKARNIDEPVNDRQMALRTIQYIKGGIQKIYDMIGKLPNRLQYHELPFKLMQKADRRYLQERVEVLSSVYDFKDKTGLDLGCNIGGVTFSLAIKGAKMTGVDVVPELIEIANTCEEYYKLGCFFYESNIIDFLELDTPNWHYHFDFCVFLATWHWLVRQTNLETGIKILKKISEYCDTLFFEINFGFEEGLTGTGETMIEAGLTDEQKVIDFIKKHTDYKEVKVIGKSIGWGNRKCLIATK